MAARAAVGPGRLGSIALTYGFDRKSLEALSQFKQEPAWLRRLRLEAWDSLESRPHAHSGDVELAKLQSFCEPPKTSVPSHHWPPDLKHVLEERGDEEGLIIQRDSTVLSRAVSKEQSKRGVLFSDLDAA